MAIIIRSSDIYEKNNHNIMLNNAIKSVSVQEKSLEIGQEGKIVTKTESANSEFISAKKIYISEDEELKLEAYYTDGYVIIPASEISVQISKNDISWELSGKSVGADEYYPVLASQLPDDPLNVKVPALYTDTQFDWWTSSPAKPFSQTGLWGENGVIKETKGRSKIEYRDNSSITNIEKQSNGDWKISFSILTRISVLNAYIKGFFDKDYSFRGRLFNIETITLNVSTKSVTVVDTKNNTLVGDTSKGQPFVLDENQLVQPETAINKERIAIFNANKVLEDWKDGKESVDLEVAIGDYYETNGDKVISDKDVDLPMFFEIGQLVTPYVTETEEVYKDNVSYLVSKEVPLSTYENGVAKNFVIYDVQQVNDGIGFQNLKLIESAGRAVTVNTLDKTGSLRIERVLSPIANAKLGYLSAKDAIYKEDAIIITASGDIRNWEILNNGITVEQGDSQTIDVTFVVEGEIDINIHAKEWRWVDYYPDGLTSQVTFDKPTYPSGVSGDYLFRQNKLFENIQIPRYAAGLVANSANHKIWYITPTVYNRVTNSYTKLPEIKVYGSDYVDFAQQYDTPYGEEGFVGSGGVIGCSRYNDSGELILTAQSVVVNPFRTYQGYLRLDVTQNNIVTFTNMALGVSNNFDCYITQIDLSYSQYEYS